MTTDEFVNRIREGERINCSNIQERNQCLILLDDLGYYIPLLYKNLDEASSRYLYPGIYKDLITCWLGLESSFIEYRDVPFKEYYNIPECTKEEFDKDFKILMGWV